METLNVKYASGGKFITACCPYCQDVGKTPDTKYHLYIKKDAWYYCYRCETKGPYNRLTSQFRLNFGRHGIPAPAASAPVNTFQSQLKSYTMDFNDSMYSCSALGYLHKRKITDDLIKSMNIKLGTNKLFGRVVFIDNANSYFVARSFLPNVTPKTLNPVNAVRPLMYFDNTNCSGKLYLVEGTFDAVPFLKTNNNVACLLGKDISEHQLNQLVTIRQATSIFIALDSDAFDSAKKLAGIIAGRLPLINIGIIMYNDKSGKDPSDYDVDLFGATSVHWVRMMSLK